MQLKPRRRDVTPLRHPRGVGQNWTTPSVKVPLPCAGCADGKPTYRLGLGYGSTSHWQAEWSAIKTNRVSSKERQPIKTESATRTDVIECACVGGLERCAYRAGRVRSGWHVVLEGVVDWWETASVGAARHTVDDEAVQELRQDRRTGVVAGQGCRAQVVHQSEWSGGDASCCETDRADGRAEHGLDEFDGIHSFGSSEIGSSRDKGGK